MFDLDDCIACITSRGAKLLAERLEKRVEPFNITRVQWIAMYYIDRFESITQRELANKMYLTEPTIVRLIDRMVKEEYVIRVYPQEDRRIRLLKLTSRGEELNKKITVLAEDFKNDAIGEISEQDLNTYKEVLNKMLDNTK